MLRNKWQNPNEAATLQVKAIQQISADWTCSLLINTKWIIYNPLRNSKMFDIVCGPQRSSNLHCFFASPMSYVCSKTSHRCFSYNRLKVTNHTRLCSKVTVFTSHLERSATAHAGYRSVALAVRGLPLSQQDCDSALPRKRLNAGGLTTSMGATQLCM